MKKLRLFMIVFCVLVTLPLAFVAKRTFKALDREVQAQVRFFADRLLDEIEAELADWVRREEHRVVDEYRHTLVQDGGDIPSPLARAPVETYILGYFQNNPDGSFQTPLVADGQEPSAGYADRVKQLQSINTVFNQRKFVARPAASVRPAIQRPPEITEKEETAFADRYLKTSGRSKTKSVLGQEAVRVEEITVGQAMNLASKKPNLYASHGTDGGAADMEKDEAARSTDGLLATSPLRPSSERNRRQTTPSLPAAADLGGLQVEVTPLQAVTIDDRRVFIFRRIGIDGQIYRQGFVVLLQPFLDHLIAVHYDRQPIARYTSLTLTAADLTAPRNYLDTDAGIATVNWVAGRTFPAPFTFLSADMRAVSLPPTPARQTLILALSVLGVVMVAGLITIYHSARTVLDLSKRRSHFVSAVTHELKTPLTNIRMYVDMLDQGMAATPEREREYLGVLASESARLSGLIDNVLELSRLEKQTRRFDLKQGDLTDVLADVQSVMSERLSREGFDLTVQADRLPGFAYDHDVLVQVLINLMENCIKFGRHLPKKQIRISVDALDGWVRLRVSDHGPGIPKRSLKKIFDDFYRVDNDLTHTTGGTGLGLALVRKFILAMGGRVQAQNNDGPGCTISVHLPTDQTC